MINVGNARGENRRVATQAGWEPIFLPPYCPTRSGRVVHSYWPLDIADWLLATSNNRMVTLGMGLVAVG